MEKGVSFRKPEILERKANEILQRANDKGFYDFNSATPMDLIIEKIFRLRIHFIDLNQDLKGVLGALDLENKIVWIDESLNNTEIENFTVEARCNYTLAHEAGHYVFHRPLYRENQNLTLFHDVTNPRTKAIEIQANMFASFILMPGKLMIKKWSEIDSSYLIEWAIYEMTNFFKVSKEAMIIRLKIMGLIDISWPN